MNIPLEILRIVLLIFGIIGVLILVLVGGVLRWVQNQAELTRVTKWALVGLALATIGGVGLFLSL